MSGSIDRHRLRCSFDPDEIINRTEDTINRDLRFARAAMRVNLRTEESGTDD